MDEDSDCSSIELPFLRNAWYVAGFHDEFAGSKPVAKMLLGEPIAFYRDSNGRLCALQDRCAHRWAPLSLGRVEGNNLRCMYHGVKYAPDGRCIEVPGQDKVAASLQVRSYPVVERMNIVWIWMGEPANALRHEIPDKGLDQKGRHLHLASIDYAANYALISDNLLDLSHVAFLHEGSIGKPVLLDAGEESFRPFTPSAAYSRPLDNGVRVEGWATGRQARSVTLPQSAAPMDVWARSDYLIPSVFVASARGYPVGTAEACNGEAPDDSRSVLVDYLGIQWITPVSRRASRYHYVIAIRPQDWREGELERSKAALAMAFEEDRVMIEAIQNVIAHHPGDAMGGIAADRGLTLYRAKMKRIIDEEQRASRVGNDRLSHRER